MRLVAIVLAAGSARRFGADKLSALFRGEPLVRHAVRAARAAPVERIIVVARHGLGIGEWKGNPPVETVEIESEAMSDSLKAGIAAAGDADGAFVFLGDMPLVPHDIASRLAARLGDHFAAVPRHDGRPGHPVLLSRRAFSDIARLKGDQGAGGLIRARDDVWFEDSLDPLVLLDIDRPEDLARLENDATDGSTP